MRSGGKLGLRILFLTLLGLIVSFTFIVRTTYRTPDHGREISLNQVLKLADEGRMISATLLDEDSQILAVACSMPVTPPAVGASMGGTGQAVPTAPAPSLTACQGRTERFHAAYPRSDVATSQLIERLTEQGADVSVDEQNSKAIAKLIIMFIFPLAMLANLFGIIFMSRGGDNSIADIAGFGTIRRKAARKRHQGTGVTFEDVGGADEAIVELKEVTDYLTDPARFKAYGAAAPKGVLLFGPPGCGKTLMARAAAGESGVPFFSISGAEFVESLVGVGAARVRDLFRQVREAAPAVVFIDEIDAVARRRGGEGQTGGEREQTVNQLLVEMDGFDVSAGIVVMAATNRPDILDPAVMRPGRFDRHITLEPPDITGRRVILELHARNKPMGPDVDFDFVAKRTPGFTGADLANVINEAALLAIREGEEAEISMHHLTEAIQRVLHGPQRRGQIMSPDERKRIAIHESGHSVVAAALGRKDEMHRVSIVARGRGLGTSVMATEADKVLLTEGQMLSEMSVAMGGIAGESVWFSEISTTSEDDIERVTQLAREMVGLYGMSAELGRIRLMSKSDGFLGGEAPLDSASPETLGQFDREIRRLSLLAEQTAKSILTENRPQVDRMAKALLEEETLEGAVLDRYLSSVAQADGLFVAPAAGSNVPAKEDGRSSARR